MPQSFDYISINDCFWIQFKEHLISFGFKGLPDNIHFTIGFDKRSLDINFHVTKNSFASEDKPQIKILVIEKALLKRNMSTLFNTLFNTLLVPINIEELKAKYDYDLGFLSFNKLKSQSISFFMQQQIIDSFKDISSLKRKTRLKIKGDIEKKFESLLTSDVLKQVILQNIDNLPGKFKKNIQGGIIITKDNAIQVLIFNGKCFEIKQKITPMDILLSFINPQLAKQLIEKTKRALISVKCATGYSEIENLNNPLRLVMSTDNIASRKA